ncbi:uncharacterized protein N7459_007777 [Penicillium hispanicum]|uniref:uncharacterized protein n=1 Tax=Penicillium hispanicum TaxID=1080232 RepID=UPI002542618F|nr:uncharacterized protein N7459_007777 [Penicillium hispanicum]KAJ5578813.1 hypothetical protein N7459_007777 [Penicillium hispanicum]
MFGTFSTLETGPEGSSKRKRQQVLRACDSCRIKRSKCDDGTPCSSCASRGWICSRTRFSSQPTSLASALIQISTLEERIRVLESRPSVASPPRTIQDLADWAKIDNRRLSQWEKNDDFLNSDSDSSTYFGPLSTARITAWMKRYLNSRPERSPFESTFHYQLLPTNCRQPRRLVESTLPWGQGPTSPMDSEIIPKSRQLQYIHHFWHFQHPLLPILCEKDFTEEFGSIWDTETPMRRSASALADIMIAAGALAQSLRSNRATIRASHLLVDDNLKDWTHSDVSVWHYHRCRRLLDDELEASMLSTVQSHIVMSVYLYNASRPSAAYNALGTAVRIAYSLGLHQDPPAVIGVTKQELRRRIWWSLYILDIRLSIELGRPAIIHLGESDCQFPGDDVETARMACQQPFASTPEVTWLTYTVQLARLFAIVQSINVEIYKANNHESNSMLNARHLPPRNPASELLEIHLHRLQAWAEALPHDLRLARTGDEPSMSPKFSGIQIDIYAPRWIQYQRVFLELLYHDAVVSLIRPVALLGEVFGQPKSLIDEIMYQLDGHTNTIIRACHQLYLETDLLTDHPELSSIMWNAAVTTLSRLLSMPGDHDVAKRLAIVAEMFQDLDGVDQNTLLALTNVRKVPHLSRWTPESMPSTAKSAANESSSVNDGANHLGVEPSMSGEVYSVTEVGPPSPNLEWGHSATMMDSSLWFNDPTWLEG